MNKWESDRFNDEIHKHLERVEARIRAAKERLNPPKEVKCSRCILMGAHPNWKCSVCAGTRRAPIPITEFE
jgi:hypothetical protein